MIADILKNRHLYECISPRIKTSLEYIAKTDFSKMEPGKYELDGTNIYVLVQAYDSIPREQGKWECHQKYISTCNDGIHRFYMKNRFLYLNAESMLKPFRQLYFQSYILQIQDAASRSPF